jgi:uncharacterized protein YndB with AHSA1/START domain
MTEPQPAEENPAPKPFHVETSVAADPDEVWAAVNDPALVRQWFGWDYDGLDAEIKMIFLDGGVKEGRRISWSDGSYLEVAADGPHSVVRVVLPGDLADARWDDVYDGVEEGWRAFLAQLRFLLERRPAGPRRTVYLAGTVTGRELRAVAGDGEVVHTADRQVGVVDPHGHLVVAGAHTPLARDEAGRVDVTVSTFGLDDAAFTEVRDRWAARWLPVAKDATVVAGDEALPPGLF